MHATVYGAVIPDDGEYEPTSEDDDGVIHVRCIRLPCRREEEHDGRKRHPADGNKRAGSTLSNSGFPRVISYPDLQMTSALTHAPRENGPGVHPLCFLQIHRAEIGIEYATYRAVIEMEKTALIAWVPANTNAPSEIEPNAQNQTVLTGVLVDLFMQ